MAASKNAPPVKIGYVPVNIRSSAAFPAPRIVRSTRETPLSGRAVQACPAVNDFEQRAIEVLAPFSIRIRCVKGHRGTFDFHVVDVGTRIDDDLIEQYVTFMPRKFWRSPSLPVVQIALPHIFVCDEPCYITQMPAWASARSARLPGPFISGRFPTHLWPRSLNLAFEWADLDQDFTMKRGEPVCYLYVETEKFESKILLVAGELTKELADYRSKIEDVVNSHQTIFL